MVLSWDQYESIAYVKFNAMSMRLSLFAWFDKTIYWDAEDILEKLGKLILPKNCAFNL